MRADTLFFCPSLYLLCLWASDEGGGCNSLSSPPKKSEGRRHLNVLLLAPFPSEEKEGKMTCSVTAVNVAPSLHIFFMFAFEKIQNKKWYFWQRCCRYTDEKSPQKRFYSQNGDFFSPRHCCCLLCRIPWSNGGDFWTRCSFPCPEEEEEDGYNRTRWLLNFRGRR